MEKPFRIASTQEIPVGSRKLVDVDGARLAVFHLANGWVVIDNHCPHAGGPVAAGPLEGDLLTCPWHGEKFCLSDGRCQTTSTFALSRLQVEISDGQVWIDLRQLSQPLADGIQRYVVRHEPSGRMSRCGTTQSSDARRGDWVIVQTQRGLELAQVMKKIASTKHRLTGELLRLASKQDRNQAHLQRVEARELLERARSWLLDRGLNVTLLDAELLFDGITLILYVLEPAFESLGPAAVELGEVIGQRVQFESLSGTEIASSDSLDPELTPPQPGSGDTMKGPYERSKYDIRRVWECPVCQHRERSAGTVTFLICGCQKEVPRTQQRCMQLVEDAGRKS